MKKLILGVLLITNAFAFAQIDNQVTLSKFITTDASKNGEDITETIFDQNGYLVFYTGKDNNLYMANVWQKSNSQSFGKLYNDEHKEVKETSENYKVDIFQFKWRYANSYNTKIGTATVELVKIYKPQGVTFKITIIPENLDVLVYKGYMEGTLNLSKYLK